MPEDESLKSTSEETTFSGASQSTESPQTAPTEVEPPTSQPAAESSAQPPAPATTQSKPKRSKKKLIIGFVSGGVFLLFVLAAVLTYFLWYQNPQKVLTDAFTNVFKADAASYNGSLDVSSTVGGELGISKAKLTFDGAGISGKDQALNATITTSISGKELKLSAHVVAAADGNYFLKIEGLRDVLTSAGLSQLLQAPEYASLVEKVDNKWIKFTKSDLESFGGSSSKNSCSQKFLEQARNDKNFQKSLADAYKQNKFIVVKDTLPTKDGSLGYVIDSDEQKAEAFGNQLKQTNAFKQYQQCSGDSMFDSSNSNKSTASNSRIEVRVSRWSHQLTGITISGNEDNTQVNAQISTKIGDKKPVQVPNPDTTYTELKQAFEDAQKNYVKSLYGDTSTSNSFGTNTQSPESAYKDAKRREAEALNS